MKARKFFPALLLASAMVLGACGPKEVKIEPVTFEPNDLPAEIHDHKASDYVKSLGSYTGLTVYENEPNVSETDLTSAVNVRLYDYAEKIPVTNGAVNNTVLAINYSVVVDGEEIEGDQSKEGFEMILGLDEIGKESDKQLLGAVAGDHFEYEVELTDAHGEDLAGKIAEYEVDVLDVYKYEVPELTKEFVTSKTEYKSVKEFENAVRAELMEEAKESVRKETYMSAIQQVTDNSTIEGYPQEVYDEMYAYYDDVYAYVASMFGTTRENYISSYALGKEVENVVNTLLVMEAIANEEGLAITEDEYDIYLDEYVTESGYDSAEAMGLNYNEMVVKMDALTRKVGSFLLNTAKVYEAEAEK